MECKGVSDTMEGSTKAGEKYQPMALSEVFASHNLNFSFVRLLS